MQNSENSYHKLRCCLASLILRFSDLRHNSRRMVYFNYLKSLQHRPHGYINMLQRQKLTQIIKYAQTNIPYYSKIIRNRSIDETSVVEYLKDIPVLTKDIIRNEFDRLYKYRKGVFAYRNTSGGSTGEPVTFMQDQEYDSWNSAAKMLFDLWAGYSPGLSKVRIWGADRDFENKKNRLPQKASHYILNSTSLNSYYLSDKNITEFAGAIDRLRPHTILSYVESIYDIARYVKKEGLSIHSPYSIITAAGTLFPEVKETVKNVFNCLVFNMYGSREVGGIACSCRKDNGLHFIPCIHYIEILKPDGPVCTKEGDEGEIVITLLTNRSMPLIRYKIGDLAVVGPRTCSCGINFPMIKDVRGRIGDIFITSDGNHFDPHFFGHLFYFKSWLKRYQVVQENSDLIRINIELSSESNARNQFIEEQKEISEKIHRVSKNVKINYKVVKNIEKTRTGKFRYVISRIQPSR